MGSKRTAWHFFFCILLRRYGPSIFEIRDEVPLSEEPPRMDYLLLRRAEEGLAASAAQTLLALWALLPKVTIAELKSVGRLYDKGELDRLWSYTHSYYAAEHASLPERRDLAALLLVPGRTPTLDADVEAMGLGWVDLGAGYFRLTGGLFTLYVVEIDRVADQPDEDLLALYSHHEVRTPRSTRFWSELMGAQAKTDPRVLEGYHEEIQKILSAMPLAERLAGLAPEERLAGLAPEERLAGLAPEERLADLDRDHQALALPLELLRLLPDDYLRSLSPEVQAELRRRLRGRDA
jgi:hypothetical protein